MSHEPSEETENFYRRLFRTSLKLARKNIFGKVRFLLLLFVKKIHNFFLCFSSPPTARQKIHKVFVYDMANKNML